MTFPDEKNDVPRQKKYSLSEWFNDKKTAQRFAEAMRKGLKERKQ